MGRRGRPPKVEVNGDERTIKVKGQTFKFRHGSDGRLRALGAPERTEDFEYARQLVAQYTPEEGTIE